MKLIVRRAKAFLKFLCIYSNSSISNTRISLIWENNKACILLMESVVRGKLYPSFPFLFCGRANYTFWFAMLFFAERQIIIVKKKEERWKKEEDKEEKEEVYFPLFLDYYALFFNIFSFLSRLKKFLVLKGANCHCQLTYQIN